MRGRFNALASTHRKNREQNQHRTFSTESKSNSLTPYQARGLLTRAQIRAPFDDTIISHKTRFSDTIDNVKAKIGNVKAKDSGRGGPRTPVKTLTGKTSCSRPVGSTSDQFPTRGTPSEKSASHDNFLPHTRSLHLVRVPLTPTEAWATTRGATPGHERLHRDAWGTDSPRHASTPAGGRRERLAQTEALMRVCSDYGAHHSVHHPM
jgi:hypothetical protein